MTNAPGGDDSMPPVRRLRAAGVTLFAGSDNIRDAWWPYGNGDMLERAMLIGYLEGLYTDADLPPRSAWRPGCCKCSRHRPLRPLAGNASRPRGNLGGNVAEAVATHPPRTLTVHAGRIVAESSVGSPPRLDEDA